MAASNSRPELYAGLAITEGMLVPNDRALPPVPLKHTDVEATIVGPLCDVALRQEFHNTHSAPIEALYVFPLPEDAAVSALTLTIGDHVVKGDIRERDAARNDYEQARDAGQGAALLEQHRPNLFGVSVTNIQPDERVLVQLRFVLRLPFDDGGYEWVLPTTITPRYTPRSEAGHAPPAAPLLPEGTRDGHTIAIRVTIDSGALSNVASPSHPITVEAGRAGRTTVALQHQAELPNRDFVLRYRASGPEHRAAAYTVREQGQAGTLLLTLLPQLDPAPETIVPRELLFVFDRSGSMGGEPIVAARNALRACLRGLNPSDVFNIFPFDHAVEQFRPASQPFTQESVDAADAYIATIESRGGTEILQALQQALAQPSDPERLRVIVFLTDGAVGDEERVLRELHHGLRDARVFAFGIGSAVNRYLLDKLAETGRGNVEYVYPGQDIEQAVLRFQNRAAFPLLTDIAVDWGGAAVTDAAPTVLPDLYAGQPVVLLARFASSGTTGVTLRGRTRQGPWQHTLPIEWPSVTPDRSEPVHKLCSYRAAARRPRRAGQSRSCRGASLPACWAKPSRLRAARAGRPRCVCCRADDAWRWRAGRAARWRRRHAWRVGRPGRCGA
jgi:Ca-activated chloride channel homolog